MKSSLVKPVKVVLGTFLVAVALMDLACGTVATPVVVEKGESNHSSLLERTGRHL